MCLGLQGLGFRASGSVGFSNGSSGTPFLQSHDQAWVRLYGFKAPFLASELSYAQYGLRRQLCFMYQLLSGVSLELPTSHLQKPFCEIRVLGCCSDTVASDVVLCRV